MSMLLYLEESHIVYNVEHRYKRDQIYTNISNILVAVNPYKQLDKTMYGNDIIEKYHKAASRGNVNVCGPHCYGAAEASYRAMCRHRNNQSLIVCGESGAGKTESAKIIMTHLTYVTATHSQGGGDGSQSPRGDKLPIEQQILAANPILEAFGNARTVLNNNSSRFGKFTKLLFHDVSKTGGNIVGSFIETYLLEKSRVTRQAEGERNFHVFYQVGVV
jgi:myosin heavy subunit